MYINTGGWYMEYKMSNRDKVKAPKRGWFWCSCDRQLVGEDRKCLVCGKRNSKVKKRRFKNQ